MGYGPRPDYFCSSLARAAATEYVCPLYLTRDRLGSAVALVKFPLDPHVGAAEEQRWTRRGVTESARTHRHFSSKQLQKSALSWL